MVLSRHRCFSHVLALALVLACPPAVMTARAATMPPPVPGSPRDIQVKAAQKAVRYGVMAFGPTGGFEGLRPLDTRERDRLLKVLGAYVGRVMDGSGAFDSTAPQLHDTLTTQWTMARFMRDQRSAFRGLMERGAQLIDAPQDGTWRYRLVDQVADLVDFRLKNLRFLKTVRAMAEEDPGLAKPVENLGNFLGEMDRKTLEIEKELKTLVER